MIPVYCPSPESLEWLHQCLRSALIQDCEIVVYDDGSPTPGVRDIFSIYNIHKVLSGSENRGVSYARNRAILEASGPLIYPLDCDDRIKPGTIQTLTRYWDEYDGTPVYSDLAKFGSVNDPHYTLLDFQCEHLLRYVGLSTVNVLYSKAQWKAIRGYNEELDFYEDSEFNTRLYARYCGVRCPEPLVEYRIHSGQRTQKYLSKAKRYQDYVLQKARNLDMACLTCGGKHRAPITQQVVSVVQNVPQDPTTMAATQGELVLAQYTGGKGRGKHYYQGIQTRQMYRVEYGDYLYAHSADTRGKDQTSHPSYLVRYNEPEAPKPTPTPTPDPAIVMDDVSKEKYSIAGIKRTPVVDDIPDITRMSAKEVVMTDFTPEMAKRLLEIEKSNLNRAKVVAHLTSVAGIGLDD